MKAFPHTKLERGADGRTWDTSEVRYEGMDLRDYFAAKAMQALINDEKLKDTIIEMNQHISKTIPKLAYEYANEMMKMRESK